MPEPTKQPEHDGPSAACCAAVNTARTGFILSLNQFLVDRSVNAATYSSLLDSVDQVKTCAFKAFDTLLELDSSDACCQAAATAIAAVAVLALNQIFPLLPAQTQNALEGYSRFIGIILSAVKNGDEACCIGISQGITVFAQVRGLFTQSPLPGEKYATIRDDLQKALCCLLRSGQNACCQAAGLALGQVAAGFVNIGQALFTASRPAQNYLPTADFDAQFEIEVQAYQQILQQILCAASSKCSRCCSEVVAGIGRLFYRIQGPSSSPFNAALPSAYIATLDNGVLTPFPANNLGNPGDIQDIQDLYLVYLDLLRKIRQVALCQFERILDQATNQECCQAVAQGLADSTSNFAFALAQVFVTLVGFVQAGSINLEEAKALLTSFANEYPPLAQQIVEGVEPECPRRHKKSSSSSSSSSSWSSHEKEKSKQKSKEKSKQKSKEKSKQKSKEKSKEKHREDKKHQEKSKPRYY